MAAILFGAAILASGHAAHGTPSWVVARSMSTARTGHTAVLLSSGKVFVTGGVTGTCSLTTTPTQTSEIYDPLADTWTPAAPSLAVHSDRGLTLSDGRVLLPGDQGEEYDPATDAWHLIAPSLLSGAHYGLLVPGGDVLDFTVDAMGHTAVEVYHPATDTWTLVPSSLPDTPTDIPMEFVRLADGRVFVVSGFPVAPVLYDPATNLSTPATAPPFHDSYREPAVALPDGRVLLPARAHASTLVYDPVTDTWVSAAAVEPENTFPPASTGFLFPQVDGAASLLLPGGIAAVAGGAYDWNGIGGDCSARHVVEDSRPPDIGRPTLRNR